MAETTKRRVEVWLPVPLLREMAREAGLAGETMAAWIRHAVRNELQAAKRRRRRA